jgi:hypothetical protein
MIQDRYQPKDPLLEDGLPVYLRATLCAWLGHRYPELYGNIVPS